MGVCVSFVLICPVKLLDSFECVGYLLFCNVRLFKCILISFLLHCVLITFKIVNSISSKMKLFCLLWFLIPITVQSSSDICLKAYKKKLCLRLSLQKFDLCLFEPFNTVFELNNKFCVTNTKCVPKILHCLGF